MEVTSDRGMGEEICKYKQGAASARQRVLGREGTGCFQGLSWGHPQLLVTVCRLRQTADKAKFGRPGLPGQSDGKKCSRSPTGQKTKPQHILSPGGGELNSAWHHPGPGIFQVSCPPSAPSNPCCHGHLGAVGGWGRAGTEQKAWDVAIGCWAGSGGKEKSFGMPPHPHPETQTRAEMAQEPPHTDGH